MNHITLSALDYTTLQPLSTSPWAFCVICWDLNLLLLFNKSTAIKIGLQLCFRLPNDIRAWNIFWLFFFFPPSCWVFAQAHTFLLPVRTRHAAMTLNSFSPTHPPTKPHPCSPAGQPICGPVDIRINLIMQHYINAVLRHIRLLNDR